MSKPETSIMEYDIIWFSKPKCEAIHVIEKTAYDELLQSARDMAKAILNQYPFIPPEPTQALIKFRSLLKNLGFKDE